MASYVIAVQDPQAIAALTAFAGWDRRAFCIAAIQAVGGLIFAAVLKYADNLLRCFSVALALVLTAIISSFIGDYTPDLLFLIGAFLVIFAIFLYSLGWPGKNWLCW
eukprot:TRINITY_DN5661_c1_g2_i1.p1 TRINITY_DN5661_c1_g2~~TRINITY_DN5661_c1_g2_i1.p1  ORF type:complete len:122 (+),score=9.85 TRINITY_DN5661_c1_g2_i1:47-367(+)